MYAYIKGSLEMKLNDAVIIEANGIGYKIYMAQNAIEKARKYRRNCQNTHTLLCKRRQHQSIWIFNSRRS